PFWRNGTEDAPLLPKARGRFATQLDVISNESGGQSVAIPVNFDSNDPIQIIQNTDIQERLKGIAPLLDCHEAAIQQQLVCLIPELTEESCRAIWQTVADCLTRRVTNGPYRIAGDPETLLLREALEVPLRIMLTYPDERMQARALAVIHECFGPLVLAWVRR